MNAGIRHVSQNFASVVIWPRNRACARIQTRVHITYALAYVSYIAFPCFMHITILYDTRWQFILGLADWSIGLRWLIEYTAAGYFFMHDAALESRRKFRVVNIFVTNISHYGVRVTSPAVCHGGIAMVQVVDIRWVTLAYSRNTVFSIK